MKSVFLVILTAAFISTPLLSGADEEKLIFLRSFPQCNEVNERTHKGGVFYKNIEDFVAWLDSQIYDGAAKAGEILADSEISDFSRTVIVYLIGKKTNYNYELVKVRASFESGILKIIFKEEKREIGIGQRQIQRGIIKKNPLYLFKTNPDEIQISRQNRRVLKKVEFYLEDGEAPFSKIALE